MRTLAACLVGFLGLGSLATMVACSDSSDGNSGGAGGASGASGGKAGGAGTGGGATCGFAKPGCQSCLTDKCGDKVDACNAIESCSDASIGLGVCVCTPGSNPTECIATFYTENGDPGEELTDCYSTNCTEACQ